MSASSSTGQSKISEVSVRELFDTYESFRFPHITNRRFTQAELLRWLEPFSREQLFAAESVGQSGEGRTVSLLTLGRGDVKVLLWSQMHGDEPTATMALMDMLNFFSLQPKHPVPAAILQNLTLLVLPMVNPDGAERFQRRTAQAIDMNRDALALETPEARILRSVQATHRPAFGFNLHDQDPRYTVGSSTNVSTIALLAPAFDASTQDNAVRHAAKQVASVFASTMKELIPDHVSKYDDTFEPRAFGDNVQRWGTSTVLVESGGWPGDREKMFIRKLNYVGLFASLASIATGSYHAHATTEYDNLPIGTKYLYDVVLRNARLRAHDTVEPVRVDVGINFDESYDAVTRQLQLLGKVVDIGDLHVYGAFNDVEMNGELLAREEIKMECPITNEYLQSLLIKRGVQLR